MTSTDLQSQFSELGHRIEELIARLPSPEPNGSMPSSATPTDALTDAEDTVVRFLDRLEAGDLDTALGLCSPDLRYRIPGRSTVSGTHEGPDAVTAALSVPTRHGTSELSTHLIDVVSRGNTVLSIHELSGHVDGVPMELEFVLRFRTEDGLIVRVDEYSADQYAADDLFVPHAPSDPANDQADVALQENLATGAASPGGGWRGWFRRRRNHNGV